jgi:hypothetical protein
MTAIAIAIIERTNIIVQIVLLLLQIVLLYPYVIVYVTESGLYADVRKKMC